MENNLKYYTTIRDFQMFLTEIYDHYRLCLQIFPLNVSLHDLEVYGVKPKRNITAAIRTRYLLEAIVKYWDFSKNKPGSEYSLDLWLNMLEHGFKFGDPPSNL